METTHFTVRDTRIQKLNDLMDKGINPYPYSFNRDISADELQKNIKICKTGKKSKINTMLREGLPQ